MPDETGTAVELKPGSCYSFLLIFLSLQQSQHTTIKMITRTAKSTPAPISTDSISTLTRQIQVVDGGICSQKERGILCERYGACA